MRVKFPNVTPNGNFMFIIKPEDTTYSEGKILNELPTLEMLQFGVGGSIELVPSFTKFGGRPCVAFCNAEGKFFGFKPNHLAHMIWEENVGHAIRNDQLVGNIVVVVGTPSFLRDM